ncbi:MAG TPA: hypothetical protein PKZ99_11430 [Azospirillaceae bacterium]|nr:hypothetical protein [Azospirillaceae bacterium]
MTPEISYPDGRGGRVFEQVNPCWSPPSADDDVADFSDIWTPERAKRLVADALETLRMCRWDGPQPVRSAMPDVVREIEESYGWDEATVRRHATRDELAKMDLALSLLYRLDDRRLRIALTGVAQRVPLRRLAAVLHCSHTWVGTLADRGAAEIAAMLNEGSLQS